MEIRRFAERVLFGDTLDDKLLPLDQYQDESPGPAIALPAAPGRPALLALDRYHQRQRVRFAELRQLHTEKERGLVLHFFANHELLALELLALALLRFPDAPDKFRRGLVQTLKDEQDHLRMYLERLAQEGIAFGQIPVSDFFWRAIAPSPSPMDFVARLSLTLEQANLDYARHYAAVYQKLGDGDTALILDRIYQDEIGHVKHGLLWFNRWRDPALSEWEAYQQALQMPLTPSRAKGIGFNRQGRLEAGLSAAFVDELEFYARSKGRCPSVYWFDPSCESQVIRPGFTPSQPVRQLAEDLALLPLYLCAPDDVVLVPRRPSLPFLRRLGRAGYAVPELVEHPPGSPLAGELARRKLRDLRPWGWSPQVERVAAPLRQLLAVPQGWRAEWRSLYSKAWSVSALGDFLPTCGEDWLGGPEVVGRACAGMEEVETQVARLAAEGWERVVVKGAFGAAGQSQVRLEPLQPRADQLAQVARLLEGQGEVVVEPWLEKVADLSAQIEIQAPGQARFLGWTRFLTDARGQDRGILRQPAPRGIGPGGKAFPLRRGPRPAPALAFLGDPDWIPGRPPRRDRVHRSPGGGRPGFPPGRAAAAQTHRRDQSPLHHGPGGPGPGPAGERFAHGAVADPQPPPVRERRAGRHLAVCGSSGGALPRRDEGRAPLAGRPVHHRPFPGPGVHLPAAGGRVAGGMQRVSCGPTRQGWGVDALLLRRSPWKQPA